MTATKADEIPVHVYFILDRSGSMQGLTEAVVDGFNGYIKEQKALPGKCRLTMIQFDTEDPHEILYDAVPIAKVEPFTAEKFSPRGGTPLWDAEGWMIESAKQRELLRTIAGKKAEAILVVTLTDGDENSSKVWNASRLAETKAQLEATGWTFTTMSLGNAQRHFAQAAAMGSTSMMNNAPTFAGVGVTYDGLSHATTAVRSFASRGERTKSTALYDDFTNKDAEIKIVDDEKDPVAP